MVVVPPHLKGRFTYAVLTAELTRGGIDARREDGAVLLVLWTDVVGVVARRAPPELDAIPFVDIVSEAGATLRILPWTRLTGDVVEADGVARARALVKLVRERRAGVEIDPATLVFLVGTEPPPRLRDPAMLAAHDAKLA